MFSVGMMHVFYPHFNTLTKRVMIAVLPSVIDRHHDWIKAKTACGFLSTVHVQCQNAGEELLISRIYRLLDLPVYSDKDRTNNMFYIAVSQGPDLYYATLVYSPHKMDLTHPCALFLVLNALWDAGKMTVDLLTHIYSVIVRTCDKSKEFWYNMLIMFVDDLRRTLAISAVLFNEKTTTEHMGLVQTLTCCLQNGYYKTYWTEAKENKDLDTSFAHHVPEDHTCNTMAGEQRYISLHAALEVAAAVLHYGHNMSPSRHKTNSLTHLH